MSNHKVAWGWYYAWPPLITIIPPELEQYGDFLLFCSAEALPNAAFWRIFLHIYFLQIIGKKDLTPPIPLEIRKTSELSALEFWVPFIHHSRSNLKKYELIARHFRTWVFPTVPLWLDKPFNLLLFKIRPMASTKKAYLALFFINKLLLLLRLLRLHLIITCILLPENLVKLVFLLQ